MFFTYPHPNLDIQPIVAVTCPECIGLHASDTPCPAPRGHLPYLTFSNPHFSVAWAGKDWLEVPPTIDKFVVVHLLTNFASQPFLSWPYVGPPQISWWGNDLGFPKPPCMCIIMYDETSLVTPPKVRALHCDVIFRSSWRQCRRRQGEAFLFVDTWIQVSLVVL